MGYSLSNFGISATDKFDIAHISSNTLVTTTKERNQMTSAKSWSEMKSIDIGNSYLSTTLRITNVGTYTLESEPADIWLSLYIGSNSDPIKTWNFGSNGGRITPLKPGETRTINVEFYNCLRFEMIERIDNGEPVRFEIQSYHLGEDETYLQNAKDTSIQLIVDNGDLVETSYYQEDNILLTDFLEKYCNMIIEGSVIKSIENLNNDKNGWWEIIIPSKTDLPNNILEASLKKRDQLVLLYQKNSDNDGILDREELIIGTDPFSEDTDNDGLNDYNEIYTYFTDPLNPDSDFDGLNDNEEIGEYSDGYVTNPLDLDSDDDKLDDYLEFTLVQSPIILTLTMMV